MRRSWLLFEPTPRIRFWGAEGSLLSRVLIVIVLAALSAGLGTLLFKAQQVEQSRQMLQDQLTELADRRVAAKSASATSPKPKPARSTSTTFLTLGTTPAAELNDDTRRHLNAVIRQLNTPWQDLFNQLERLTPAEVALLSIEPDTRRDTLKLKAEAKTLDTLLVYAASLEQQGLFGRLTYSKHETNDQDANKPIRLSFELEMRTPDRLDVLQESLQTPSTSEAQPGLVVRGGKL